MFEQHWKNRVEYYKTLKNNLEVMLKSAGVSEDERELLAKKLKNTRTELETALNAVNQFTTG